MNDAELSRASMTAIAFRDHGRLKRLRGEYEAHHPRGETEHLLHVASVCVGLRFGQCENGPDPAEIGRFIAETRSVGSGFVLPRNWLDTEGFIRGLLGEPGILDHIDPTGNARIITFLVQYLTDTTSEISEDFDTVIERARGMIRRRIMGDN